MGENFRELLKVGFSQLKLPQIVENDGLCVWQVATLTIIHGQEMTNEIDLGRTRYKVVTVDRGYHVYTAVWEVAIGQILSCEQEGGNIHPPYAVTVAENNDMPINNDALVLNKNFPG